MKNEFSHLQTVKGEGLPSSIFFLRSFDYIAVLRPILLIPVWTLLLLGYYRGLSGEPTTKLSLSSIGSIHIIPNPHNEILVTLLIYSLLMGAVYILNQLSDSMTDEINGKLFFVAEGFLGRNSLKIQIGILFLLSTIMAYFVFPPAYLCLVLLSIMLGVFYSVPPIRLKGRPVLDLFANAAGFGILAFVAGWISKSKFSLFCLVNSVPYFLCVSAAFINTTIPDIEGDLRNGDITTGAFLGIRRSCIVSTMLVSIVPLVSWFLGDFVAFSASIISLPFFVYMTISNWDERSPRTSSIILATKVSLLILSLLVAMLIPFYFVLLILTILLVRLYYRTRFGIKYP